MPGGGPEKAALGSAGLKEKSGHQSKKGTKIQPDPFQWNKSLKPLGKEQQTLSLRAKVRPTVAVRERKRKNPLLVGEDKEIILR